MENNRVKKIYDYGQSIWLDFIDRQLISSGQLKKLIQEDGIRGITSNPAIFEKAISSSNDYDADIHKYAEEELSDEDIFYQLAIADIRSAADLFLPVYEEKQQGADGYVSLEVSPLLAMDTEGTIEQAQELWHAVDRKNVMIKIPATKAGLPAIQTSIAAGININVTLLFSLERYEAVAEAYLSGLEERVDQSKPINGISSVASFFLSRIDVLVDPILHEKNLQNLEGKVAISSAKKAYEIYKQKFSGERWEKLAAKGARPQRLLWASTGNKNPAYSDVKYVEALIGPDTVNTIPMETLEAFRDHGDPAVRLEQDLEGASSVISQLHHEGIDLGKLMQQLEDEGIEKFNTPYRKLLAAIASEKNN